MPPALVSNAPECIGHISSTSCPLQGGGALAHGRCSQVFAGLDSIFSTLISPRSRKAACIPGSVRGQPTQTTCPANFRAIGLSAQSLWPFRGLEDAFLCQGETYRAMVVLRPPIWRGNWDKRTPWEAFPLACVAEGASLTQGLLRTGSLGVRTLRSQFRLICCRSFSGRRQEDTTRSQRF